MGKVYLPDGRALDDRTTLTRLPGGSVRQVIELSRDGGTTWAVRYDAEWKRAGK